MICKDTYKVPLVMKPTILLLAEMSFS